MKTLMVDRQSIRKNIQLIKNRADRSVIYAVLKGNGYGLGLIDLASLLRDEGINRFAVTEVQDAVRLRRAGFVEEEILMLRPTADEAEIVQMLEHSVTATIGSYDSAVALNGIAERNKTVIEAHIKIDTGMGRYGFLTDELDKITSIYKYMSSIAVCGIYTHFYSAFSGERATREQYDRFNALLDQLKAKDIDVGIRHAANSSALFRFDFANLDAVRIGSAIVGRLPGRAKYGLIPVGRLECDVSDVRWLPKGHTVGYGAVCRTKRPTKIAVLPVGYADGFCIEKARDSRRFSDTMRYIASELKQGLFKKQWYVTIAGKRARVLGHVGMMHTTVDVTDIECKPGDRAALDASPLFINVSVERRYI